MVKKTLKISVLVLMMLIGMFLVSNIYILGDHQGAIEMHEDLAPNASAFWANAKVLNCFFTGLLYVISSIGIIRKRYHLTLAGVIGAGIFIALYLIQLWMWAGIHPRIWFDFSIFGGLALLFGIYSWRIWQKRETLRETDINYLYA